LRLASLLLDWQVRRDGGDGGGNGEVLVAALAAAPAVSLL